MSLSQALQPYLYSELGRKRFPDYFQPPGARETCRTIKLSEDPEVLAKTIRKMCRTMAEIWPLDVDSVLIPAPQHTGDAVYTRQMAEELADLTGARVADVLKCRPHRPLYEQKEEGAPFPSCVVVFSKDTIREEEKECISMCSAETGKR